MCGCSSPERIWKYTEQTLRRMMVNKKSWFLSSAALALWHMWINRKKPYPKCSHRFKTSWLIQIITPPKFSWNPLWYINIFILILAKNGMFLNNLVMWLTWTHHGLCPLIRLIRFSGSTSFNKTLLVHFQYKNVLFQIDMRHLLCFLEFFYQIPLILFKTLKEDVFAGFDIFQASTVELPYLLLTCWETSDSLIALFTYDFVVQELI